MTAVAIQIGNHFFKSQKATKLVYTDLFIFKFINISIQATL
jgi:hypothetical protein